MINRHRLLDKLVENADKSNFLSDWNCQHPFFKDHFENINSGRSIQQYHYIRADDQLTKLISDFHQRAEGVFYNMEEIVTGNGSTTIISSLFIWLRLKKISQVYYIPPVYFTITYFSKLYGIDLRPISKYQLYEKSFQMNLPNKKCVLLITDPVWYAGISVPDSVYAEFIKWQEKTGSTIIVDGSFQYFKWNATKFEMSSQLNKNLTLRLVCPTKSIATHGFRFSYILVGNEFYDTFDYILDNICGSNTASDIDNAERCMQLLLSESSNTDLIDYTKEQFSELLINKVIDRVITPNAGYFIFATLKDSFWNKFQVMEGEYFQQKYYPGYIRINLLSQCVQNILSAIRKD